MPRNRPPPAAIMRLQHRLDPRAEHQIGIADDAGADPGLAVGARGRHRRDAIGELDLADRPHLVGAGGAVHRQPFKIDRRDDVVPAAGIGEQIGQADSGRYLGRSTR